MEATATAERLFGRAFHSEADRQSLIEKKSRSIQRDMFAALMRDHALAEEVADSILTYMQPEIVVNIIRCALTGDIQGAGLTRQLFMTEIDDAVQRIAELRAIKEVEEMTPADFEN